jgi:hypothetical protein
MNKNLERVTVTVGYNNYKYYQNNKDRAKAYYLEKKRKDALHELHKDYYKDYWTLALWKVENMREYKKNKINNNINNET